MVKSTFSATGACLVSALLASSAIAAPAKAKRTNCSDKQILLPMRESTHGASFNITVGTPPQTVTLLSDWTWQTTWVDTAHCRGVHDVSLCIPPGQNFFDDAASSTFQATPELNGQTWLGTDYTPGIPFVTWFGKDTLCFESDAGGDQICMPETEISLSNFTDPLPVVFDIGGVFGFAPVLEGYNASFYPATYQFMKANLLNPVVGWHMCGLLKDAKTCYGEDYLTIMGGTDEAMYNASDIIYHDLDINPCVNSGTHLSLSPSRENYWSTTWTGFFIGDNKYSLRAEDSPNYNSTNASPSCDPIDPIAIWDQDKFGHGAPMPLAAFDYLVGVTGAHKINDTAAPFNAGTQGLWAVPKNNTSNLPNINYELSKKQNITITPEQYIDCTYMPGTCLLNARTWDRPIDGAQTFFGLTVISHTYLVFDYDSNKVGVAPVKSSFYL
ncbi:aspartic peptidase domain-containing protein [Xylogone sp. PMI_703]|nr:aspartic peptidase domain-containing protein [Xylogone sp. PMI_703]